MRLLIRTLLLGLFLLPLAAAPSQKWIYCSQNLWVDENLSRLEELMRRAQKLGYTHLLLADSKFSKLNDMDARYFRNVERVKTMAAECKIEVVPALFSIGYSNDLLWHDPNLIEGLPVNDLPLVVRNGTAELLPDPKLKLKGGDFTNLKEWDWKDDSVQSDSGAAVIRNGDGGNARIVQKLSLKPFRQYHMELKVKTVNFKGTPEVKVLSGNRSLNYNYLGTKPSQDWTVHHVVFNSLNHTNAMLYLGVWGAGSGELWFDDLKLEETAFLNLIRRPGAPLKLTHENGTVLTEGKDFASLEDSRMGRRLWPGSYDIFHASPKLKVSLPEGSRLRASYYHAATVHDDQAAICPSEPKTLALLKDQAERMHKAWGAKGYMMSHDEIRVWNWCHACQSRNMTAGELLADNVRSCVNLLKKINPGGTIYVWSDMFDPHHNAVNEYYLVRGSFAGAWEGLEKDVVIVPWYFEKRNESLKFFADRGHRQVIAGYYDHDPSRIREWINAASKVQGVLGVMYTTWENDYSDLEKFAEFSKEK
ncbi:MAG: hypothetical protein SFY81_11830 [Verrucomicrobiota bacterium]|nr:hypothetical protein [Verrucomicrobiota bacterium]